VGLKNWEGEKNKPGGAKTNGQENPLGEEKPDRQKHLQRAGEISSKSSQEPKGGQPVSGCSVTNGEKRDSYLEREQRDASCPWGKGPSPEKRED